MVAPRFHGLYSSLELCFEGLHDSQAYRMMDVTREHTNRILELREIPLSFQTGFNLVNAAILCYPEEYLGLGSLIIYDRAEVLEACDFLKLLSVYSDLFVDASGVVCNQLGLQNLQQCY